MGKQMNSQRMPLHVDFLDVDKLLVQVEAMASPMKVTNVQNIFSRPPDNTIELLNENNVTQKVNKYFYL